ncbi:MAG: Tryptophan synthase alpha chain, partial [Labilithrix sp.]|nr:Tryptophan synthase alpha chain [Labilithrix sp.]
MTPLPACRRPWMARMATVVIASGGLFVFACSEAPFRTLGYGVAGDAGSPPAFVDSRDAGEPDARAELTQYCPSNKCPAGRTTCPTSPFACDVDLRSDLRNCGACGNVCATTLTRFRLNFDCVDGQCVKECSSTSSATYADCNGVLDDGCEIKLGSNDNCNGCGDRCPDPKKPCIFDAATAKGQCGCDPGLEYCGRCIDPKIDDLNCGGCGVVCDPGGDGGPPRDHAYYGCAGSECGHLKCEANYASCDNDSANGCETSLLSPDNCGVC